MYIYILKQFKNVAKSFMMSNIYFLDTLEKCLLKYRQWLHRYNIYV